MFRTTFFFNGNGKNMATTAVALGKIEMQRRKEESITAG